LSNPELEAKIRIELQTVREQVLYLLEKYPATKDSDTLLEWYWLRYFHEINLPWESFEKLQSLSLETVRRNRQKIQSEGLYPPSPEVAEKRRRKQNVYREHFREYGESV